MTEVQVYVTIGDDDVLAGTLYTHRRRATETSTFTYAAEFLSRPGAYALEPGLPLGNAAYQTRAGQALFGAMSDCAPDRWGRTLVKRREVALARVEQRASRSLGEVEYLLGVRDDLRQGALRFRVGDGAFLAVEDSGVPDLTDVPALMQLADRAENDTADLPDLQRLIRAGSSLGGARPKAHVRDVNGRVAIAKFPSANHDTWNVMAWEKVALDLAARAGIDVPTSRLLNLAGRSVLVVDRFDRTASGQRLGYVSAMTMLEASDGDRGSYIEIAGAIETESSRATADLHQLWRRIVFSVLISNTDDHLRNHGFINDGGGAWRLSPAFDMNPNPEPGPKFLSTAINEVDDAASIQAVLSVADYFRLSDARATAAVQEVADAVNRWPQVAQTHGLTSSDISAMEWAFRASADTATA